jgi:hypothetical protein
MRFKPVFKIKQNKHLIYMAFSFLPLFDNDSLWISVR